MLRHAPRRLGDGAFGRLSAGLGTHDGLLTSIYRLAADMITIH